jgi:ABC-type molybdate transport system permease subunit
MRALDIGSDKSAWSWCFWSTTESIQKDAPSVTAIIETLIAIPLYWWIALQVGMLSSLLLAVAVAPLVLLRSEESVALGISWLLTFEKKASINVTDEPISAINRCFLWGIGIASIAVHHS